MEPKQQGSKVNISYLLDTFLRCLTGVPVTLGIAVISILLSIPFAFCLAMFRFNNVPVLKQLSSFLVIIIRGTPLILIILILYSLLPSILNVYLKSIGSDINIFDANPIIYAVLTFWFISIGTTSEIIRSSLESIDKGQFEAYKIVGLSGFQGYWKVIIPQMFKNLIPNLSNHTITIIKGTSLVFLISVQDVTGIGKIASAHSYNYLESYVAIFFVYLIICSVIELIFSKVKKIC